MSHLTVIGTAVTLLLMRIRAAAIALVFLAMFAFQGVYLDADPSPLRMAGDFSDEGLWQHNARCKVLFGAFQPDDINHGIIASPLFTAIQWGVFSLVGPSLWSARLIGLASLWLILVMLFVLIRREATPARATCIVVSLGLMHEMLMYAKWSTPILPEMCFLTAVLFFWELGRRGNASWMILSGAAWVAAAATKLTAIGFGCPLVLLVAGAYAVRKDIDKRRILMFGCGVALAAVPLAAYFWIHRDGVRFFMQTIGVQNLNRPLSLERSLAVLALRHDDFVTPGVAVLLMLSFWWLLDQIVRSCEHGIGVALQRLSSVEFLAACWLAGCVAMLAVSSNPVGRRFIMLYLPLGILAGSFAFRQWAVPNDRGGEGLGSVASIGKRCALWAVTMCVWFPYAQLAVQYVGSNWLGDATMIPNWVYAVAVAACAIISAVFFLGRSPRIAVGLLVAVFFVHSLALNALWYGFATFTIRDEARAIGREEVESPYLVGMLCYELAMENESLPICDPWIRWIVEIKPFNAWFDEACDDREFLMLVDDSSPDAPINAPWRAISARSSPGRLKPIKQLRLWPVPLFGDYRYRLTLYRVAPSKDER